MSKFSVKAATVVISVVTVASLSGVAFAPVALAVTVQELQAQIAALQAQLTALSAPTSAPSFTRDLTVGSKGADVKSLQQWLNANGYPVAASGAGSAGNETTYFGNATKAAVAKYQAAKSISPAVGYFGPKTRASLPSGITTTTTTTTGTTTVAVPATGLAVSLAADTPAAGGSVPKSAANVTYLKFNLAGSGTVSNVTVKRTGAGAPGDFSNVYLYDGATRLTSGRSINGTTHEVNFTSINVAVSGVKTLTVSGDVAAAPGASDRNAFSVTAVQANVAVTGLPVSGNGLVNASATAGTLTVEKSGSLSNPNVGQASSLVSQFRISANTEDAKLQRIALFQAGTVSKSNISNFVLKDVNGTTLATASAVNAKDLVVLALTTPYAVNRGETKNLYLYADIGTNAKKDDTVKLYVDEASDIYAIGSQYGYGVGVTKTAFDSDAADHHVLTLQGAKFSIVFNGPNVSDIARRGKDVTLFDFTLSAANNIEVRKLNASVTSAGIGGNDGALTDFKVSDVDTGVVVAGPTDLATNSMSQFGNGGFTFSDVFNITAGKARHLKITADIPAEYDTGDTLQVNLTPFTAGSDLKNLDNNTFLAAAEISPSALVSGNTQTVKVPTLTLQRAGTPSSANFVKGTQKVPFLGLSLQATADDIKVTTIKISATPTSGTIGLVKSDTPVVGLYEGTTLIGTTQSFTGDALPGTATFTNLNYTITKGSTKVLTVKADLSSAATVTAVYDFAIAQATTTDNFTGNDVVANDTNGSEPFYAGAGSVNYSGDVVITVLNAGSVTVAEANDGSVESRSALILTGSSKTGLGKFRLTATNEDMTIKKLELLISNDSSTSAAATSTKEVSTIYLFDDAGNQIGAANGYSVLGSGASAGNVSVQNLNWTIPKNSSRYLVVKGDTNTITAGAVSGRKIYTNFLNSNFEASGAASTVTTTGGNGGVANSNFKVIYKAIPTIAVASTGASRANGQPIIRFTVTANSNESAPVSFLSMGVHIDTGANAYFGSATASPSLTLKEVGGLSVTVNLTASATSSNQSADTIMVLPAEQTVSVSSPRTYDISLTPLTVSGVGTLSSKLALYNDQYTASLAGGTTTASLSFDALVGAGFGLGANGGSKYNGFVWSDNSATAHATTTQDWANGALVNYFPSDIKNVSN